MSAEGETILERLCDPCKNETENVPAKGFCQECGEYLCSACLRYHRRLAGTKTHNVIQEPEMIKEGIRETKMRHICPIHEDQNLDFYCQLHDQLSCLVCKTKVHSDCEGIVEVSDFIKKFDMNVELNNIISNLNELQTDVTETLHEVKTSFNAVQLNHDEATACLANARQKVDAHLDQLQTTIKKEIRGFRESDSEKLSNFGSTCQNIDAEIGDAKRNFDKMKHCEDTIGLFEAMKSLKNRIAFNQRNLVQIRRDNTVRRYKFTADQEFLGLQSRPSRCGGISVTYDDIKTAKFVKNLNAKLQNEDESIITAIEVIDSHKVAVVDNINKSLKLIDIEADKVLSSIKFETSPWGVSFLGSSSEILGITLPESKVIAVLDVSQGDLRLLEDRQIKVEGKCYGIYSHGESILVSFCDPAKVQMFDKGGTSLKAFDAPVTCSKYLAVDRIRNILFLSNQDNNSTIKSLCLKGIEDDVTSGMESRKYGAMATDRTGHLYISCCIEHIHQTPVRPGHLHIGQSSQSVRTTYEHFVGVWQYSKDKKRSFQRLLDNTESSSMAYCNQTNRLYIGIKGKDLQVYYVV